MVSFLLTPGSKADNNPQVLEYLLGHLQGTCCGDKGYISSLFARFYERGATPADQDAQEHEKAAAGRLRCTGAQEKGTD